MISFIRVALIMMQLPSNRTLSKILKTANTAESIVIIQTAKQTTK